ncbi:MAG: electron transfer flavoprotein subunit beta/FixA family protein [Deltaproteobacteria bacterium]|nr:electron transfer flavoprotein subunit beta/FixA family protein [Deltaproteobacteria bacterium]
MNIVVCLKQVPDTETVIKIAGDGKSIVTDDIKWVMNPYDEFAVEEALKIKQAQGGEVTVVGAGPKRVTEALRTALAMGADKAVLVEDDNLYGLDPLAVAKILAAVVKDLAADIVLFGQRAVDDDCGLVSSAVAELLDLPQLSVITKLTIADGKAQVNRPIEGETVVLEAALPVVVTAGRGLNEPRYASLPGIMKAKKKPLTTKTVAELGVDAGGLAEVVALTPPPQRAPGKVIAGETPAELAANLAKALREEAKAI